MGKEYMISEQIRNEQYRKAVGTPHILVIVSSRSQEAPKIEIILENQIAFQTCITKFNISHIRRLWLNLISFLISPHITW